MKRCAIVGAGDSLPSADVLLSLLDGSDFVIAADGGWDVLEALHVEPDVFLGDLDSLTATWSAEAMDDAAREGRLIGSRGAKRAQKKEGTGPSIA